MDGIASLRSSPRAWWVGKWVAGWVGCIEEKEAVGMRCWTLWVGGWVGGEIDVEEDEPDEGGWDG